MTRRTAFLLWYLTCICTTLSVLAADTQQQPVWQTDLGRIGFIEPHGQAKRPFLHHDIAFLNDGLLAAGVVVGNDVPGSSETEWQVAIAIIDTGNGAVIHETRVPVQVGDLELVSVADARLVLLTGSQLVLMSSDLNRQRTVNLQELPPGERSAASTAQLFVSPTGRTLMYFDTRKLELQVFDAVALERKVSCKYDGTLDFRTWPQTITDTDLTRRSAHVYEGIEAQPFCGEWRYVWNGFGAVNPVFLSDKVLIGWGGKLGIFESGKMIRERTAEKKRAQNFVYTSPQASRFVLEETILTGVRIPALDISYGFGGHEVTVFSASLEPVWRREFKPFSPWPRFALSPDGKKLAELADGVVRLHAVP